MDTQCTHQSQIQNVEPRTPAGCEECIDTGDQWVHLRLCLTCGHVGCCDSSPNQHAARHFHATQHPIVEPFLSGDHWRWCYVDQVILEMPFPSAMPGTPDSPGARLQASGGSGGLLGRLLGSLHRQNYLVGVIDDPVAAERGAHALRIYGFTDADVVIQGGREIAARLEHPDFGSLVDEATSEEVSICRDYNELAREGVVLSVYTPTPEDVKRACHLMTAYGAHSMLHFGSFAITEVPAGEGCW